MGVTLKTSPLSNLQLSVEAAHIASRPQPTSISARERRLHGSEIVVPLTARAPANHRERWPWRVEQKASAGLCGLVPRGHTFEHRVHDAVEPRRSGLYEFVVVGVDLSGLPGELRYHAWEATGHFDCTFSSDDVERRSALERYGRSVALQVRPTKNAEDGHSKRSAGLAGVVRWPDGSSVGGLVHGRLLPEVDDHGRPLVMFASRFPPRNSADLLSPLMHRWWRDFANRDLARSAGAEQQDGPQPTRILVLDGTGRAAARIALEADPPGAADVVAVDDPSRPSRLCDGDEQRFNLLLRECLRVAQEFVLVAEDVVAPGVTEAGLRRWKATLRGELAAQVLVDGELRGGRVPDHFLSRSGADDSSRRFFIVRAPQAVTKVAHE